MGGGGPSVCWGTVVLGANLVTDWMVTDSNGRPDFSHYLCEGGFVSVTRGDKNLLP